MKVILDPLIYWFLDNENTSENFGYFKKVVETINKYFDVKYIFSPCLCEIMQKLNKEPHYKLSREEQIVKSRLISLLIKNFDYTNSIQVKDKVQNTFSCLKKTDNLELNNHVYSLVNEIIKNNIECLFLLSIPNHISTIEQNSTSKLYFVKNISGEIDSKITDMIENEIHLKESGKIIPTLSTPLPYKDLCDSFYSLQQYMLSNGLDRMSVFKKVTREVALRNHYTLDKDVTRKNNTSLHHREIYTYKKEQYISSDFESGAFELCDKKGKHKDEITYIGEFQNKQDKTGSHDIIV